ncbi:hypothetical protein [Nitrosomonas marina]|uniref:Uncharacterized protein n=1 Tax=Nitrosomonas marina TaxID=917 RepID=A0A1H8IGP7_9PROT|nr:hypothetical protein [Nitrosomonas marina]SEN68010.1 hypothetical protein SAMN05216325_1338 [Nitrosomonas marina]
MDKVVELNREYWGRIHDMCAGTKVKPWECIRWHPEDNPVWRYFSEHPQICSFEDSWIVEFAVTVIEDKPVWVGSVLYDKDGNQYTITGYFLGALIVEHNTKTGGVQWLDWKTDASWTPPAHKRTFTLNGEELPCPVKHRGQLTKTGIGISSTRKRFAVWFESKSQCDAVMDAIEKIITEARDK